MFSSFIINLSVISVHIGCLRPKSRYFCCLGSKLTVMMFSNFMIVLRVISVHIHDIMEILNKFDDFHGILAIRESISTVPTKSRYFGCLGP